MAEGTHGPGDLTVTNKTKQTNKLKKQPGKNIPCKLNRRDETESSTG